MRRSRSCFRRRWSGWSPCRCGPRRAATLLGVFGALALASVGLCAVMAYSVTERQRKIELLMALAADAFDVRRLVLPEGMTPVGIGRAIGLARSLAVSPVVATLLYGVSPPDIVTFGGVSGLLAALAPLASYLPPGPGEPCRSDSGAQISNQQHLRNHQSAVVFPCAC